MRRTLITVDFVICNCQLIMSPLSARNIGFFKAPLCDSLTPLSFISMHWTDYCCQFPTYCQRGSAYSSAKPRQLLRISFQWYQECMWYRQALLCPDQLYYVVLCPKYQWIVGYGDRTRERFSVLCFGRCFPFKILFRISVVMLFFNSFKK